MSLCMYVMNETSYNKKGTLDITILSGPLLKYILPNCCL